MSKQVIAIHRLIVPLVFPAGLVPGGEKTSGNFLEIARNGMGQPVLRGSAIAGVFRSAWVKMQGLSVVNSTDHAMLSQWFGFALGGGSGTNAHHDSKPSPLQVADAVLEVKDVGTKTTRTFNNRDRHSGAVRKGGLFSLEVVPPGAKACLVLLVHADSELDTKVQDFFKDLLLLIEHGLVFGGQGARGVGLAKFQGEARYKRFDLKTIEEQSEWLDADWNWRKGNKQPDDGDVLQARSDENLKATKLRVKLRLAVPRGQDVCVGDGIGNDYQIEPQRITDQDGVERWLLPGSSLRGAFRAWFTRLAARDALSGKTKKPFDSVDGYLQRKTPLTGDEMGWLGLSGKERADLQNEIIANPFGEKNPCPIADLFGSFYSAGRIHISDALSTKTTSEIKPQHFKHVAIDRITGGSTEGALFDHSALTSGNGLQFEVSIVMTNPDEHEVEWLARTIRAVDTGLVRIGTSKSAGRLALACPPEAKGEFAEKIITIKPCEV